MSRAPLDYRARTAAVASEGFDPDQPVEGYYRFRLRRGGHPVGVAIRVGLPLDPDTGEELDRAPRPQAYINGEYVEMSRVWPQCASNPITKAEHDHLVALQVWGKANDPDGAQANPQRPIDLLRAALPF